LRGDALTMATTMSLRDQLKKILPDLLPVKPAEAVKGTELIQLIKYRLKDTYSDATLRYHFTILCSDATSPIAKVEQGQGYYLRKPQHGGRGGQISVPQARLGLQFENSPEVIDLALSRHEKFRAIFARDVETSGRFPFLFESSYAMGSSYENVWKYPDAALIDWESSEVSEKGLHISSRSLGLKRTLGMAPFHLSSVKLKFECTPASYREDFFQALSNARWGHAGELVIATAIDDTQLADELRQLGAEFGLGIVTYGLERDVVDELPPDYEITRLRPREFEAIQSKLHRQRLSSPSRRTLEWRMIDQMAETNDEFRSMLRWIERCLADETAYTWDFFKSLDLNEVA
jgi:hypothetical protein